jgi:hypothetical protein
MYSYEWLTQHVMYSYEWLTQHVMYSYEWSTKHMMYSYELLTQHVHPPEGDHKLVIMYQANISGPEKQKCVSSVLYVR